VKEDFLSRRKEKRAAQLTKELAAGVMALPGICRRIERAFFETKEDWAKKSSIISAKYMLEDLMRCTDELSWLTEENEPAQYPGRITQPTESYCVSGSREAGFELLMPLLQKRGREGRPHPQKVKAESVRAAAVFYLEKLGLKRCLYERCTLTYTVMIGPETGGNIGDADNLDTKQITDALTGIFFADDNLTHVRLVIEGEMTEGPSHTRLKISGA